LIEEFIARE
jgi:Fe-S oxidoreductase